MFWIFLPETMHFIIDTSKYFKVHEHAMISDEMHSDTIAIRQKNTIWKVESYNFR